MPDRPLTEIRGVGPATAHELAQHGFTTVGKLASARSGALTVVSGFGPARAAAVREAARELLAVVPAPGGRVVEPAEEGVGKRKKTKKPSKKGKGKKGAGDKGAKKGKKAGKGKKNDERKKGGKSKKFKSAKDSKKKKRK